MVDYGLAASQNWRLMFGLAAIPAALMSIGMLFQHESPHWLAAHGQEDKAREALRRVRNSSDIDAEIRGQGAVRAPVRLLDRTGRRPLLIGGTTGMAAGMLVVGFTFLIGGSTLHGGGAYIAIAGLLIYAGSFAIGLGPVFWLLISEIYPVKIRGPAMSVATMASWGANFVVTVSFLTLLSAIGNAGPFFLFAGLWIVALVYFQRQVP